MSEKALSRFVQPVGVPGRRLLHHIPLDAYLRSHEYAAQRGAEQRARAIELFDVAKVGEQWQEFLS